MWTECREATQAPNQNHGTSRALVGLYSSWIVRITKIKFIVIPVNVVATASIQILQQIGERMRDNLCISCGVDIPKCIVTSSKTFFVGVHNEDKLWNLNSARN